MSIPAKADILVIGGGPAGSTAATQLARRGYEVVLIDRAQHPRETVGESILPSAWKYFDLLGVTDAIERHGFVKKAGGVVDWGNELTQIAFRDFAYDRPGLHVERAALDHILLEHARQAGARVFEGVRAEQTTLNGGGGARVTIAQDNEPAREVACRFLVDATGQASLIARQLSCRQLDPAFRFISLWAYFVGSNYVSSGGVIRSFDKIPKHPPMTFVSHLGGWGWAWHIPLKNDTSVGIVVPVEDYKRESKKYASLEEYFLAVCRSTNYLGLLMSDAKMVNGGVRVIRDFSYLPDSVAGPGYFIVGDAAGFVDPIFSIGFVMALYSGQLAAWTIDRTMRRPAQAEVNQGLFEKQMRGRYELARTMALPGLEEEAGAKTYFNFFSRTEKELMWSAASMTTRSGNLVRSAGDRVQSLVLKRRELDKLNFEALASLEIENR
jgi:flavin-dependent dehydrogenase